MARLSLSEDEADMGNIYNRFAAAPYSMATVTVNGEGATVDAYYGVKNGLF